MDSGHTLLEILECVAILLLVLGRIFIARELRDHMQILERIPQILDEFTARENDKVEELLVSQSVMMRRLKDIERRLSHGSN
jgi:hypothetical protein